MNRKPRKAEKCSYCGKESDKLIKVGPDLRYCDYQNCYAKDCLEKYPDTSLAKMISEIYPDTVIR